MTIRARWPGAAPNLLAGLLTVTGSLHFVIPETFVRIVPERLPAPYALVYASGVAELLCAAGLVWPRTRRVSGWATALLFVSVFPANVAMALDSGDRSTLYQVGAWARLPVQVPLVIWAVAVARHAGERQAESAT